MSDGLIPNSFTLHSGTSHTSAQRRQRVGEKRETKQERERGEGIQESQTELPRVGRETDNYNMAWLISIKKIHWGLQWELQELQVYILINSYWLL